MTRRICDLLVIGSGVAGMSCAITAGTKRKVVLVSATAPSGTASALAQGGIACAFDDDDAPAVHAADTLKAGRGLCRPSAVQALVDDGPARVEELARMGVRFDDDGRLEGGHTRRRVRSANGAQTGREVASALWRHLHERTNVECRLGERVQRLWVVDGRCIGALTNSLLVLARAVVLATGGYAALWKRTTNPPGSRGDGILLAWDAGARVADLEFVQFHPTALPSGALLTEALRGEGAILLDAHGERFVDELAPRDEVARAIARRGGAWLDLRPVPERRFPALMADLRAAGYVPGNAPVPVAPAAHYTMGGIVTDLAGRTNVPGLYAVGECACTGAHGANRLASNSLLECLVFGTRAGERSEDEPESRPAQALPEGSALIEHDADLAAMLEECAGPSRDAVALGRLGATAHPLAQLIAHAGLAREESRGAHFRSDFPVTDTRLGLHLIFSHEEAPTWQHWN